MKDSTLLLLAGGAAAYYLFIFKPQQNIAAAGAAGAGAVGAVGQGIGDFISGIVGAVGAAGEAGLAGLAGAAGLPGAPGIPGISAVAPSTAPAVAVANAVSTWVTAGGTTVGPAMAPVFVMPAPVGQIYGLTVQQPAITKILTGLAMQGYTQPLATVTTVGDIAMVQANKAREVVIKAEQPGNRIIGHRTQGGVEIYTLKNMLTGAISIVRK